MHTLGFVLNVEFIGIDEDALPAPICDEAQSAFLNSVFFNTDAQLNYATYVRERIDSFFAGKGATATASSSSANADGIEAAPKAYVPIDQSGDAYKAFAQELCDKILNVRTVFAAAKKVSFFMSIDFHSPPSHCSVLTVRSQKKLFLFIKLLMLLVINYHYHYLFKKKHRTARPCR